MTNTTTPAALLDPAAVTIWDSTPLPVTLTAALPALLVAFRPDEIRRNTYNRPCQFIVWIKEGRLTLTLFVCGFRKAEFLITGWDERGMLVVSDALQGGATKGDVKGVVTFVEGRTSHLTS